MPENINGTRPKSYSSIVHHGNDDYEAPLENQDESFISSRRKSRVIAAVAWILLVTGCLAVNNRSSLDADPFAELLTMALPQDVEGGDTLEMEGMAPAWATCKATGKEIATECYELNPVDKKACKDRGKEAAKACYKDMGKDYKDYWKGMGKKYKEEWKAKGEAKKEEFKGGGA